MGVTVLDGWLDDQRGRIVSLLGDWIAIPSISAAGAHQGDLHRSARWAADLLAGAGMDNTEILDLGDAPAVYADWLHAGADAPTVVIYGHHDVQPVDPLEEWTTPPFEPNLVGDLLTGELRGRGAVDDKGQVMFQVEAVRGLLAVTGSLPVNVKFLLEGAEEIGSPGFEELLVAHRDRLACDAVVVSDTDMWAAEVPSTCLGMRGLVAVEVGLRGAGHDLHSGLFGGAVANPVHHLARMVARLHDSSGRVALPGFYDRVRELTPAERDSLDSLEVDEARWMEMSGAFRREGEADRDLLEQIWTRPTCEVVGLHGGYGGDGVKTIVPATATAKVTFRLVPDQDPDEVARAFEDFVSATIPSELEPRTTRMGGVAPALTPPDHPGVGAVCRAIEAVWERAPVFTRIGGSGPEEALGRVLDAPVLYLGVALPDDGFHAPNERMRLEQMWKGLRAAGELWLELGRLGRLGLRRGSSS